MINRSRPPARAPIEYPTEWTMYAVDTDEAQQEPREESQDDQVDAVAETGRPLTMTARSGA